MKQIRNSYVLPLAHNQLRIVKYYIVDYILCNHVSMFTFTLQITKIYETQELTLKKELKPNIIDLVIPLWSVNL